MYTNRIGFRFTFQPTNACNLACTYCYQDAKHNQKLNFQYAKKLIDAFFEHDNNYFNGFLLDAEAYDYIILDFMGGEATLAMDVINQIVDYFFAMCDKYKAYRWYIHSAIWLQTNGTTYFRPEVQDFIQRHWAKLDLPITIDGSQACHDKCRIYHDGKGSYNDVEKAVKHYMQTYKRVPNTKITLSPDNIEYMFGSVKNVIDLGYPAIRISWVNEDVWEPKHDQIFKEQLEQYYKYKQDHNINFQLYSWENPSVYEKGVQCGTCGADGTMITMDVHGNLYLCPRFSEISDFQERPLLKLGTWETGITDEGIDIVAQVRTATQTVQDNAPEKCKTCKYAGMCDTCPAHSYQHYGKLSNVVQVNCEKNKIAYHLAKKYSLK